jgi:hypothetical protein
VALADVTLHYSQLLAGEALVDALLRRMLWCCGYDRTPFDAELSSVCPGCQHRLHRTRNTDCSTPLRLAARQMYRSLHRMGPSKDGTVR